jgi:hypothetical protein
VQQGWKRMCAELDQHGQTKGRWMIRPLWVWLVAVIVVLRRIAIPAIAWAHHAAPRSSTSGEWTSPLLWFVGACVFVGVFVATWAVFSFLERRQRSGSDEQKSSQRS